MSARRSLAAARERLWACEGGMLGLREAGALLERAAGPLAAAIDLQTISGLSDPPYSRSRTAPTWP